MEQQVTATPINSIPEFLNQIDTWKFILENSLNYYKIKFPKINGIVVKYEEDKAKDTIDTRYKRFNELEYAMTDLMTGTEEAVYRAQNQAFFKLLFTAEDVSSIVNAFNGLLTLNSSTLYSDAVKSAARVRENYYNTLSEKDYIGGSENDLVLRYKRIYMLRKQAFHNALSFVLHNKTPLTGNDFDYIKVLYEKDVDYAFGSVDKIVENILQTPSETFLYESKGDTISEIEKEIKEREKQLKNDYEKIKSDEHNRYNKILEELNVKEKEELESVFGTEEEKRKAEIKAKYDKLKAECLQESNKTLNDAKYKAIRAAGDDIDKLKKVLAYEEKALPRKKIIERGLKDPETYKAMANYAAEKSAGFIIRSIFSNPKPSVDDFANDILKDLAPRAANFLATFVLGPFGGGIAAPFINGLFSLLWGVEEPVDPNKARFDHIDEELTKIQERLDVILGKLNGINSELEKIEKLIQESNKSFRLTLKIDDFNKKIASAREILRRITTTYTAFYKPESSNTSDAEDLLNLNKNLRDIVQALIVGYWDQEFNIDDYSTPFKVSPTEGTIAYELNKLADNKDNIASSFDEVVEKTYPLVEAIMALCDSYLKEQSNIQQIIAVTYSIYYFEGKKDKFDKIFTHLEKSKLEDTDLRAKITNVVKVLETYGQVSSDIWQLYNNYTNKKSVLNITHAFGLEKFNPKIEGFVPKPIFYNYKTGKFEEHPEGKFARFFLVPNEKNPGRHLLHCVNEDFDQSYLSVKMSLRLGGDNELVFGDRPELDQRIRLVALTDPRLQEADKKGRDQSYMGQLDTLVASEKTVNIGGSDNVNRLIGLPMPGQHLGLYYNPNIRNSSIRINHDDYWIASVGRGNYLHFRLIEEGHGFEIFGNDDSNDKIQFSGCENPIRELGIFDMTMQLNDKEHCLYDNRYLSIQNKSQENRLEAFEKLSAKGLKTGKTEVKFDNKGVLKMQSSSNDVYWYAGIERKTSEELSGKLAVMKPDGNFVMYDEEGKEVWCTDTGGHRGKNVFLELTPSYNLVISEPNASNPTLWSIRKKLDPNLRTSIRMNVGEILQKGAFKFRYVTDNELLNIKVRLLFTNDGKLRLEYIRNKNEPILLEESNVNGEYAVFEPRGRLVIYNKSGEEVWSNCTPENAYKNLGIDSYLKLNIENKSGNFFGKISLHAETGAEEGSFWSWKV